MAPSALAIALLALVVAWLARSQAAAAARRLDESASDARRRIENAAEALRGELETTRRLLARLAAGESLPRDMIVEGRLWRDVASEEGSKLVEAGTVRLLDVRTPQETAAGVIPGALRIPIDELEHRLAELPRIEGATLVYCAGGGRSAAACEFLSREGYEGLLNLEGGFLSWSGPRERPTG